MKQYLYVIKDALGIHARPAGLLVKEASKFSSTITIQAKDKLADAKRIMAVMRLGVKQGDQILISIEGEDELTAFNEITQFLNNNL
ncbi:HPr family phosphocarrier protein [Paludicola sp. MB14-C6]|uniref:HPr family phosphocarrier protein n=1 Tax=Paludihabitans sp. MB14-C6 TaxID=3070656 RepID=UPI0027DD610C|nr:HPr family phosphocarrier protein [Paludicola sp. MB14-C6]WMJ22863.1 HPr family phosphocarrier protein [Paludicola sp. MB14-C6]